MGNAMEELTRRAKEPRCKGFAGWEGHPARGDGTASGDGSAAAVWSAAGDNPFCGDSIEIRLRLQPADGTGEPWGESAVIEDAAFDGYACSLCTAAADILLERVRGMRVGDALALGYDDLLALMGGPRVGRTRSGCVRLPLTVFARAVERRE